MDATPSRAAPAASHVVPRQTGQVLAHFTLHADIEPSVLPRTLQAFALRNLTPHTLTCRQERGRLRIDLTVLGLEHHEIEHLRLRLDQMVPVHTVFSSTSENLPPPGGPALVPVGSN